MAQASVEKLKLGLLKRKEWPQCQKAVGRYARAAFAKRKRAISPGYHIVRWERVKVSESRTLARERGRSEQKLVEERVDSTVKEGRFQGGN